MLDSDKYYILAIEDNVPFKHRRLKEINFGFDIRHAIHEVSSIYETWFLAHTEYDEDLISEFEYHVYTYRKFEAHDLYRKDL